MVFDDSDLLSYDEDDDWEPNCPYCGQKMGYDTYDSGGGGFYCNCLIPYCESCHVALKHDGPFEDRDGPHLCRKCEIDQDDARWLIREQQEEEYYSHFD